MKISPYLPVYDPQKVQFDHGKGALLFDILGKRYFDWYAGIGVTSLGHANPDLINALKIQSEKIWHISNAYIIKQVVSLSEKFVEKTFADTVFLVNSGAESVECALKMARVYQQSIDQSNKKTKYICFYDSFHGRTIAASAASSPEKRSKLLEPYLDIFVHALPNMESVKNVYDETIGAIMIEPIQGEGGIKVIDDKFLCDLRKFCDEKGIILIFDCIQCGASRTGKFFAFEFANIEPDICCLAKGIGGGFPVGACLAKEKVAKFMTKGLHGSTFGGNPLACAVVDCALEKLASPAFLSRVSNAGTRLRNGLEKIAEKRPDVIDEIRGRGLMLGVRLKNNISNVQFSSWLLSHGIATVIASDNVFRVMPPLVISDEQIDESLSILETCVEIFQI